MIQRDRNMQRLGLHCVEELPKPGELAAQRAQHLFCDCFPQAPVASSHFHLLAAVVLPHTSGERLVHLFFRVHGMVST